MAVADFNRDGNLDLVVANNAGSNTVSVLLGNGDGSFQSSVGYGFGITYSVAVADFNGDGILDLAVEGGVLLGNGDGTFRVGPKNPSIDGFALSVGDFNHDGKLDLAAATIGEVTVLLGNGDGTFQSATNYSSGGKSTSVAVGDFNLDGIPDLAVADQNTSGVGVLVGDGQGAFLPAQFVAGIDSNSVAVADFNGDGRPDIAVAAQGNGGVTILINSATQTTLNATSTTLSASEMFAVYGKPVTFIASVNSFGGTPTGTIDIPGVGSGTAPTFTTTTNTLNAGSNSIIATYSGDSQFAPSNSPPVTVDVSQGRTSTAVSSSTNPSFIGQSLTYSATVTGNGPVTGSVTFNQNSTVLATVPLLDGKASYSILYTTAGRRKITVVYGGDQNNVRSSSPPLNQTVEKAPTTSAISSSLNPSNAGQIVTFLVTVSSSATGLAIPSPTGTVTLENNGTKIGTGRLSSGGVSFKVSSLAVGTNPITATYSGDRNYTGATSPILDQVVN
ncbi:MAG TPA: Ig-like domain repeat protein [Candidatus Acidoferrales bacterium]|nr:Ig-like domain repeat protein [Candidatus Acidoferrales bacterium]